MEFLIQLVLQVILCTNLMKLEFTLSVSEESSREYTLITPKMLKKSLISNNGAPTRGKVWKMPFPDVTILIFQPKILQTSPK